MTTVLFHHIFSTEQRLTRYIFCCFDVLKENQVHCCWHGQKVLTEKNKYKNKFKRGGIQKEIANPGIIHIRLITESPGEY